MEEPQTQPPFLLCRLYYAPSPLTRRRVSSNAFFFPVDQLVLQYSARDGSQLDVAGKMARHRIAVVKEILSSEQSYNNMLHLFIEVRDRYTTTSSFFCANSINTTGFLIK